MINSRQKGAGGEREWATYLRENFGLQAVRGRQYSGGEDSPDVSGSWDRTHCEVKRVERLCLSKAMAQAIADCGDLIPYVAHRKNLGEWMITVRACDLLDFCIQVVQNTKESPNEF